MRMLGTKTSLSTFRWDLVYLSAQLTADQRPGVAALAGPVQTLLTKLKTERDALEQAEDAVIVASALLNKKDQHRDGVLVEAGGVARASDKAVYTTLFPKLNPSGTARLGVDAESAEVSRILGELAKLPVDHLLRTAYEPELIAAEAAVKAADAQSDEAVTALALQRSQLDRFKLEVDQARLSTHGQLVTLLKDKAEADAFYRPVSSMPADEAKPDATPPTTPASPSVPGAPTTPVATP